MIQVLLADGTTEEWEAKNWYIEEGVLHIRLPNQWNDLASYGLGEWRRVCPKP